MTIPAGIVTKMQILAAQRNNAMDAVVELAVQNADLQQALTEANKKIEELTPKPAEVQP